MALLLQEQRQKVHPSSGRYVTAILYHIERIMDLFFSQ